MIKQDINILLDIMVIIYFAYLGIHCDDVWFILIGGSVLLTTAINIYKFPNEIS